MWKVLIADDEPKIRKGLRNAIDWSEMGMEIAGEAEDGEIALDIVKAEHPDILLVDICMPFLNGLELIEKINSIVPGCIVIVVTGHDEFTYAQQALKLKVFDYLLKPVMKDQLKQVLEKAKEELSGARSREKYMGWASRQLKKNLPFLKEQFMNSWVNGHATLLEIQEQMKFFDVNFDKNSGMLVIKVLEKLNKDELLKEWDRHLLLFAVQNIVEELLSTWTPNMVFRDRKENIIAITPVKEFTDWLNLGTMIEATVERYLKQVVLVGQKEIGEDISVIPEIYEELTDEIKEKNSCTPVVLLATKYIESNYYKEDLSLEEVARHIQISATYLSRLLKQEIGASFIDYLTQVRVKKAIQLLNDPKIKIYEAAEKVGYSSQHYFSTAFKRVLGVSPVEYRKGGRG